MVTNEISDCLITTNRGWRVMAFCSFKLDIPRTAKSLPASNCTTSMRHLQGALGCIYLSISVWHQLYQCHLHPPPAALWASFGPAILSHSAVWDFSYSTHPSRISGYKKDEWLDNFHLIITPIALWNAINYGWNKCFGMTQNDISCLCENPTTELRLYSPLLHFMDCVSLIHSD